MSEATAWTIAEVRRWERRDIAIAATGAASALALAAAPMPVAAALPAAVGLLAVALARPFWIVCLLVFSVPYESLRQVDMGGAAVGSTEVLVALLAVSWLLRWATTREREEWRPVLALPLLLVLMAVALATLRAVSFPLAAKELIRWAELLVVYLVALDLFRSSRRQAVVLALLLAAGVSQAWLGLLQFAFQWGPDGFRVGSFLRAYGTFGQPNPYAGYLGTVLPLGAAVVLYGLADRRARGSVAFLSATMALALLVAALGASLSRGGWMGFALALGIILLLYSRRAAAFGIIGALSATLLLVLGAFGLLPAQIAGRLDQIWAYFGVFDVRTVEVTPANWAIVERMAVWQAAWGMFETYPFVGVGPGNYSVAYPKFAMPGWDLALGHAHNIYLNFLAETGAIGLAAFLVFWIAAIVTTWRSVRRSATAAAWWRKAIPLGVLGVLAQMSLHSFFDNLFVHGLNVQLALLLAMAAWPAQAERKAETS